MIVANTRSVSFAKRQTYFLKRKLGLDLSFCRKATDIFDVFFMFLSNTFKKSEPVPVKVSNSGPAQDFSK